MTGYTGVYLARIKGNLSATLRLACASCIDHDSHTRTDPFSSGPSLPPKSLSQSQNSSLPCVCDVFELGKNGYSWLMATCDAL